MKIVQTCTGTWRWCMCTFGARYSVLVIFVILVLRDQSNLVGCNIYYVKYVCTHTHIYIYTYMYVCMCTHTHIYIHTYMYIHTCICIRYDCTCTINLTCIRLDVYERIKLWLPVCTHVRTFTNIFDTFTRCF